MDALLTAACVPLGAALGLLLSVIIPAGAGAGHHCPPQPVGQPGARYVCQYPPDQAAHVVHWLVVGTIVGLIAAFFVWFGRHSPDLGP